MSVEKINRRRFLARASSGAALLTTGALVARGAPGANERLSIGAIGVGGRNSELIRDIQKERAKHNVAVTAVCDVWRVNLERAAGAVERDYGAKPRTFTRFGDLLALDDVDAVTIATPDFAHTPIMLAALRAGKDVYVEKPMAMTVAEANEALDLARQNQRVVQAGTQRRSMGSFKAARAEIAGGGLGYLSRISASENDNAPRWLRPYEDCREKDVDWDAYLFNRPRRPFNPRLLRRWHLFKEFTTGLPGLWMSHFTDAVNMLTGSTYPRSVVANGGIYLWKEDREHCDTFHALLDYPEGFLLSWSMGLGNRAGSHFMLYGQQATLDMNKLAYSSANGAKDKEFKERQVAAQPNESHVGNWLECIRTRRRPNADIEYGHQHSLAAIMAAAALESGRRHIYDSQKREIRPG